MWMIIAVVALLVVVGIWGFSRLRRLTTSFGLFDCSYRSGKSLHNGQKGWAHGLCEYQSDRLLWWRIYSLSWKPSKTWMRENFDLTDRIPADEYELPDHYLVQCKYDGVPFELMMSAEAYHGLASWVESAPPTPRGYDY